MGLKYSSRWNPLNIYFFKVNNRNTFKVNNKDSKTTLMTSPGVFIFNFEQILDIALLFSMLTLNK